MGPAVGETVSETEEKERGGRDLLRGTDRRTTVIQIAFIPALRRQTLPLRAFPAGLLQRLSVASVSAERPWTM